MKPLNKVKIKWSSNFAYAIGLITTDGCLSIDQRHIDFTSKDLEQLNNFMKCLGIKMKIGYKKSGFNKKRTTRIQFGDKTFYDFLIEIGLTPAKSKTLGNINIPDKYFFDFLRGHFDGDGTFYSYWDKRWKHSFMFYTCFISASKKHIDWLREEIFNKIRIKGHITKSVSDSVYNLKYAKSESVIILREMYHEDCVICLSRKRLKIKKSLATIGESL
ncbi:MAG: LAGLIDADG family homing endonuclease [Candidatus Paceibacterota bacterium]|jgi:hypothetical protein